MAQHDQQTSRETVPSYAGSSPPTISSYEQGSQAFKKMLESRDLDPVSIWQTLLPSAENLIDGRHDMLKFDHSSGEFQTQVSSSSSRQHR